MSHIRTITRPNVKILRTAMDEALKVIEEHYGVSIEVGNARFNEANVTFKVVAAVVNEDGQAESPQVTNLKRYALRHGLDPNGKLAGLHFDFNGLSYTLEGYKPRATKYPFIAKGQDGQSYKLSKFAASAIRAAQDEARQA